jgi:S1-C subfamily serine protease
MTVQVTIKAGFIRLGRSALIASGLLILLLTWGAASHSQDTSTIPRSPASATAITVSTWGTGFVVGEGYVLTALHVVQGQSGLFVGPDAANRMVPAELVQTDATLDLALLKARLDYPPVVFAPTTNLPTGLEISVIGFPQPRFQGLGKKITQGIINGYRNERHSAQDKGLFQISAEVSKGNSGGPVFAPDGTVIGMVQRKINAKRVAEQTEDMLINVSYALRSSQIIAFLQSGPASPRIRNLSLSTVLRPYQIFEQSQLSVVGVIGRSRTDPPAQTP